MLKLSGNVDFFMFTKDGQSHCALDGRMTRVGVLKDVDIFYLYSRVHVFFIVFMTVVILCEL